MTLSRFFAFLFMLSLLMTEFAAASRQLPGDYIRYPVMITLDNGRVASGFYLTGGEGEAYFVTAKHLIFKKTGAAETAVLKGEKALLSSYPHEDESEGPVLLQLDLPLLLEKRLLIPHQSQDVLIVRIGAVDRNRNKKSVIFSPGVRLMGRAGETPARPSLVGAGKEIIKRYKDVSIGNEVFIFGYPTSLGIDDYPQIDYTRPLLRKGVIAGKNNDRQSIILDCPVYYGNSGGPVVEVERTSLTQTRYFLIGMVSEFIPFDDKWYGIKRPFSMRQIENSGYSVVISMDAILALMEESAGIHGPDASVAG